MMHVRPDEQTQAFLWVNVGGMNPTSPVQLFEVTPGKLFETKTKTSIFYFGARNKNEKN